MPKIHLEFTIKGYPGTARKIEDDSDLAHVASPDLTQGAFMGDAKVVLGGTDLSTSFGWVTLIYWCLSLIEVSNKLETADACELRFSESDDFMSFRLLDPWLLVAASYRPGIAVVPYREFVMTVKEFVKNKFDWIQGNYPTAFENPAMSNVIARAGISFPAS